MAAGFERRARRLLTMVTGPRCRFLVSVAAIAAAGLGGACGQAPQHRAEAGAAGKVEKVEQRVAALEDPCPPPTDVCRVQPGTRDAVTGECSYPPALNGTSCDDGDLCTQGETCLAGSCRANSPYPVVVNLPIKDRGYLGAGNSANAINASGDAVGGGITVPDYVWHAWRQPSSAESLVNMETELPITSPSMAEGINDAGTIVGYDTDAQTGDRHTFRSGPGAGPTGFHDFPLWGDGTMAPGWWFPYYFRGSWPSDINGVGQFVGTYTSGTRFHGYRHTDTDGDSFEPVPDLVPNGMTFMNGIYDSGTAVGSASITPGPYNNPVADYHAVLFDDGAVDLVDLNLIVSGLQPGWTLNSADRIKGDYIVGYGTRDDGTNFAYRWNRSKDELVEITGGWPSTWATAVNAEGDVVGTGLSTAEHAAAGFVEAFVFTSHLGFKKLGDLVPHPFSWYPWYPWYLPSAGAINAAGQIVGGGYHTGGSNGNGSIVYRVQLPPGEAAVCQARDVCGAGDTDSVCLFSDGVVDLPDGRLVAIFGFDNASSTSVQPTQNEVSVNDGPALNNPQPAPPADLAPGTHNGAFLPTFTVNDHKISWTVNGEPVTATVSGPHLPWVPMPGGGIGVVIAGRMIPLTCVGLQDGTACNDGNACTTGETCQSGLCVGGSAVTCPSDQCHASGTCDPTIGCPPPKPDGTACDDGNVCTQTETCEAGTCREPSPQLPVVVNLPIVDFGPMGFASMATDVNASGVAVGWRFSSDYVRHAWRQIDDGIDDLEPALGLSSPSAAMAISDGGTIVGYQTKSGATHTFRYAGASFEDFDTPSDGSGVWFGDTYYQGMYPNGINDAGQFVGIYTRGSKIHAYRYSDGIGREDAPTLVDGGATFLVAISDSGTAVGTSWSGGRYPSDGHAVLFENNTTELVDLNDIALVGDFDDPDRWTLTNAYSINGDYIVGDGLRNGATRAFRLKRSTGAIDQISGGWFSESAYDVNAAGDVVGAGFLTAELEAGGFSAGFVFTDQLGFKKLDDLIPPNIWWGLRYGSAINRSGEIVGVGYRWANNGHPSAFSLTLPVGHEVCASRDVCGPDGDAVCLFSDGVVETSPGHFTAVFGYDNGSASTVHANVNQVRLDGEPTNPQPPPPADLSPGVNAGAYTPEFLAGQTISWTVNGETVVASAESPPLTDDILPTLVGIANNGAGVTKAIFSYKYFGPSVTIPYGAHNSLWNQDGFIGVPPESPPQTFVPGDHAPFVATLGANTLTWKVRKRSVTATSQSNPLSTQTLSDGTKVAILPGGGKINLDLTTPQEPVATPEPDVGERFYGALSGNLSVSPSGAATYTVPIAIPPGIAGMAPNLSLVYSSQAGDGIAGQGWELAGLSMIHRCPLTSVQDGVARPVMMNGLEPPNPPATPPPTAFDLTTDGLCLDGQRLFQRDDGTYHLEREDNSVIKGHAAANIGVAPQWFTVETKTGETRYYGLHRQARVIYAGGAYPGEPEGTTAVWALDRVVDAWGNYFDIQYNDDQFDFFDRGLIVTRIDYTGHFQTVSNDTNTTLQPETAPFHSIKFAYSDRAEIRRVRFGPATLPKAKRLTSIQTPLGTYALGYLPDIEPTLPSRLGSIGYCAAGGAPCLDPLVFDWDGGGPGWQPEPHVGGAVDQAHSYELPARIDSILECTGIGNADCRLRLPGTQFIDLNGDGRVDFVKSIASGNTPNTPDTTQAWLNNGHGWSSVDDATIDLPLLKLPAGLVDTNGTNIGTTFADMDGDGRLDLVTREDHACVPCTQGDPECPPTTGIKCNDSHRKPVVYYSRGTGWEPDAGLLGSPGGASTFPASWGTVDFAGGRDQLADFNGDGRTDLIRVDAHDIRSDIHVLLNLPNIGWVEDQRTYNVALVPVTFADVNRDGFADAVHPTGCCIQLNMGVSNALYGSGGPFSSVYPGPGNYFAPPGTRLVGDVDGDGYHDSVSMYETITGSGGEVFPVNTGVFLSTGGTDYLPNASNQQPGPEVQGYLDALLQFEPPVHDDKNRWVDMQMADLNADGLADLIVGISPQHDDGRNFFGHEVYVAEPGHVRINNGRTWGGTGQVLPVVPVDIHNLVLAHTSTGDFDTSNGATFIDLNGDGVTDLAQNSGSKGGKGSWINTFRPPVIKNFPNGVAQKTQVKYVVTTSIDAATSEATGHVTYTDNLPLAAGTTYLTAPLRVVSSVEADDGLGSGSLAKTAYTYSSLRGSSRRRGPQGFHSVGTRDERSGIDVVTTYVQQYPYTGLPTVVEKTTLGGGPTIWISRTTTKYCDTVEDAGNGPFCTPHSGTVADPFQTSRFIYPVTVVDESFPPASVGSNPGPAVSTTTTQLRYDQTGNVLKSLVRTASQTGETYEKLTENAYLSDHDIPLRLGKLTQAIVTSRRILPADSDPMQVRHVTEFDYAQVGNFADASIGNSLRSIPAMIKKRVEPNANQQDETTRNTEMHTAYGYDGFGHVVLTKACATDFGECDDRPEHVGPPELPFRITKVSYAPTEFSPPSGRGLITSLDYGPGRFPVVTTNSLNHREYSVYSLLNGSLRQKTGPNGITTCSWTDPFGQMVAETARCGSDAPLTTTTMTYRSVATDLPLAKLVTVTRTPAGDASWTYTDALGRKVATRKRAFDGRFIESGASYDPVGRPATESKAHFLGAPVFTVETHYDPIGRVDFTTQSLGQIIDGGSPATSQLNNTYAGLTNSVDETVGGKTRHRSETKNALGKASVITESVFDIDPASTHDVSTRYDYDGDGNLRFVRDPAGNVVETRYDVLGRKITSIDPDLGTWHYEYNGFGDLVSQTDAKDQKATMTYDVLGRLVSKTELADTPEAETSEWVYDAEPGGIGKVVAMVSAANDHLSGTCSIPHATLAGVNRAGRSFKYNQFGDVEEVSECVDGTTFFTSYEYDSLGRQSVLRYPDVNGKRLAVGYHYTGLGYLHYLTDLTDGSTDGSLLWRAIATDAFGQITDESAGNGVETVSTRNPSMGWLMSRSSTAHRDADKLIQNWGYGYDEAGNLRSRSRADEAVPNPSIEVFGYDSRNRVRISQVTIPLQGYASLESFVYDDLGNITQKSGKTYGYNAGCVAGAGTASARPAGPHAVCTLTGESQFAYDGNGNMTSGSGRTVEYNAINKAKQIHGSGGNVEFIYGADGNRVVQDAGTGAGRTVYVGLGATGHSLYERTTSSSGTQHVHFIYAGGMHGGSPFALRIVAATTEMKYYSFDHLGSVTAVSDELGRVATTGPDADVLGYDPWGARRNPDGQPGEPGSFTLKPGHREFTGHETIPNVGLINMNGRVYDPLLGRFLSADPNVQSTADLQSFNRYSYVLNNPLRNTDPTGFIAAKQPDLDAALIQTMVGFGLSIAGAAACAGTQGVACGWAMGLINAFYQSTVMVSNGASWGQAIAVSGFSLLIGKGTEQIVKAEDGSLVSSLITGGASGVANKAFSSAVMGRSISGLDLLESAAQGAAQSAVAWGMGPSSNVTKASAESAQGGRDKDWGIPPDAASRRGIVRRWISVSDDKGGTRGYIGVVEYRDQTGGLVIELVYKSQAGSPDDLNWVQTVDTSRDRKTGLSSHFIDNGGGGGTNYYMSPARAVKEHGFRGFDAHFWDDPQRTNLEGVPRPNVRWEAELSLVSTRNHSVLMTLTYGFSTDVLGRATVMPLVPAQPSNFQKGAVP